MYAWSNPGSAGASSASSSSTVVVAPRRLRRGCPRCTRDFTAKGIWDSICRAAGVPATWDASDGDEKAGPRTTDVVLAPAMARTGRERCDRPRRDARVQQCTHVPRRAGRERRPTRRTSPGQYPEVVIKQLQDYKRGDRASTFMQALARSLSDRDIARHRGVLRLAAQGARPRRRTDDVDGAGAGAGRRSAAQHRAVRLLPRRHRAEARRAVARGHAEGVPRRRSSRPSLRARGATTAMRRCATWRAR